jgi:hypothetical protein
MEIPKTLEECYLELDKMKDLEQWLLLKEQDAIADYTRGLSNQISSLILDGKLKDYEEPTNADPDVSPTKSTWNLIHTLD